tara:strand:- start:5659 stop:6153 length:495 start_codon:yes stop_codon:yes gene_type:complete
MADERISEYTVSSRKIPLDSDLVDFSDDDGGGGFATRSKLAKYLKNIVAEKIAFDCGSGSEGTVTMDWNCTGKFTAAHTVVIRVSTSGKYIDSIELQIGSTSGAADIMPLTDLSGGALDMTFSINIEGATPGITEGIGDYYLTLVSGGSSVVCDVFIYGHHEDA